MCDVAVQEVNLSSRHMSSLKEAVNARNDVKRGYSLSEHSRVAECGAFA
jgi:hypothetical protein